MIKTFGVTGFGPARLNGGVSLLSLGKPAAAFPGRVATDADLMIAVDRQQTRLAVPLDSSATSMTVESAAAIGANNLLTIDAEIVRTTGAPSGNVVPIFRGFDGTTPALHLASAVVSGFVDAYHHNSLVVEVEAIENALGPNLSALPTSPLVVSNAFRFLPQTPGGSLVVGANSITLTPVPPGVNGTDANHYLYISGGTGTAEAALIIGGAATAGDASGTLIIQCANAHSGAWTIESASDGIQEAIISVGPVTSNFLQTGTGGGVIFIPVGMHDVYAPITLTSNVTLAGANSRSAVVRSNGTTIIRTLGSGLTGCVAPGIENLAFDLNLKPGITGLDLYGCHSGNFINLFFTRGNAQPSIGIHMHGSPPPGPDYCADNYFRHIHMEEGPVRCLVMHRATLTTFQLCRFSCDTGPMIDLVEATDTNYFYDINLSSGSAAQGIFFNSSNTPPDGNFGVGSFHFENVIIEGPDTGGVGIVFGNTQDNHITNLGGTWGQAFLWVPGQTTGCTISNIFGFGMAQRISEWASDGFVFGTTSSATFIAFNRTLPSFVNGANHNIAIVNGAWIIASGPTAAFSVSGFTGGVPGRVLYLLNSTLQAMTIQNLNAGSTAANQINTLTGADIVLRAGRSFAQFIYDDVLQQWVLMSTN